MVSATCFARAGSTCCTSRGTAPPTPTTSWTPRCCSAGSSVATTVEPQYLGATTVSENAAWAAQGDPGPVVVLNACQVGQAGDLLSTVGGFAKAFLDAGASAFVSCLWSVREEPSRMFVEKLYEELLAGNQISVASARAREAARKGGDASLARVRRLRPSRRGAQSPAEPQQPPIPHPPGRSTMARYALCVGINEFRHCPAAAGSRMRQRRQRHGQGPEEARVHRARAPRCCATPTPTRKKVMAALTEMVGKAKSGDHVVFSFSSHGTQVPNSLPSEGDAEPDGLDEAFACHDIKQKGDCLGPEDGHRRRRAPGALRHAAGGGPGRGLPRHLPQRLGPEGPRRHRPGHADGSPTPVPAPADAEGPLPGQRRSGRPPLTRSSATPWSS